jgi:hypothetical protein
MKHVFPNKMISFFLATVYKSYITKLFSIYQYAPIEHPRKKAMWVVAPVKALGSLFDSKP